MKEQKPQRPARIERWAVRFTEADPVAYGGFVGNEGFTGVGLETRKQAERAIANAPSVLRTELIRLVEVREGEEIMPIGLRHLASRAAYGDGRPPRTPERLAEERELFAAWDAACVATNLERIDPPYETLRAFLAALNAGPEGPE